MIPDWLRNSLASPPSAGAGVHGWLFSMARQLHAHMSPDGVRGALTAATAQCGRRVTDREIRDAVKNSYEVRWTAGGDSGRRDATGGPRPSSRRGAGDESPAVSERWPAFSARERECRITEARAAVSELADLWERSPVCPDRDGPDDWLDWLFPDADWLCLAVDHPATARTRRAERWTFGPADGCGLVVPSPMTGPSGITLDGKRAHRCLGNTGPRRWLVIEFDKGTADEQAALHWHLDQCAAAAGWPRLCLACHSGRKSLHGWYGLCGAESVSRDLMAYAVTLGADPSTWNRSQLVRLPGGRREARPAAEWNLPDGWPEESPVIRQTVFYFAPQCLTHPENSPREKTSCLAHGMPPGCPPVSIPSLVG